MKIGRYALVLALATLSCGGPAAQSSDSAARADARATKAEPDDPLPAGSPAPSEPFELLADDVKLTVVFEGGPPLCAGRTQREASGKYVVELQRKTARLKATDACGGLLRRSAILPPRARASLEQLVEVARTPKEIASFGANGEVAQGRHAVSITRKDGRVVRLASGALDAHEGHGPRIRAYLDTLLQ